jgi:TonB family protein
MSRPMKSAVLLGLLAVVACSQTLAGVLSPEQLRAIGHEASQSLLYAPKPDYPLEARARRFTGAGMFIIRVHVKTGRVVEVRVARSTGHAILDQAALRAFSQWRFKPGALKPIGEISPERHDPFGKEDTLLKIPCDFTLVTASGAFASDPDIGAASGPEGKRVIYAPRPDYPLEARQQHLTGSGLLILHINRETGTVSSIDVKKSTGHKILDDSAVRCFLRWRFTPGKYSIVKVPIRYTMTGATY